MHKSLLTLAILSTLSAASVAAEPMPPDIENGVKLAPILVDAVYEALAPDHGHRFRDAHTLEIAYALQHPVVDSAAWEALGHPAECKSFWAKARESHARIVDKFTLPDFHTNLDIDYAVIAGGVSLGVTANVVELLARHLEEPGTSMASLCEALEQALPAATAVALSYKVQSKEYTDLAKLSITAMGTAIPTLLEGQQLYQFKAKN